MAKNLVCHRIDGLEAQILRRSLIHGVCHRIDGLEDHSLPKRSKYLVCHRIDGLEDVVGCGR